MVPNPAHEISPPSPRCPGLHLIPQPPAKLVKLKALTPTHVSFWKLEERLDCRIALHLAE